MTSYHGSKKRVAKSLANFIDKFILEYMEEFDFKPKTYIEPFAGMVAILNSIIPLFKDSGLQLTYKGGDINESVILMWSQLINNKWIPSKNCTKKQYYEIINNKNSPDKGYWGHLATFRGIYCGAYFKHKQSKIDHNRNRVLEYGDLFRENNVKFSYGDYTQYSNAKNAIIYCDPPYNNTECRYLEKFDFNKFVEWCRKMTRKNNIVLVSSYNIEEPDFMEVFSYKKEKLYFVLPDY